MPSIDALLRQRFSLAIGLAFGPEHATDPLIKTADPKFADYQSNLAMTLAKRVNLNPRQTAQKLLDNLKIDDICETPTIAGPGFINLRLKKSFLAAALKEAFGPSGGNETATGRKGETANGRHDEIADSPIRPLTDSRPSPRAGVELAAEPLTVVVDYSAPNVAKQLVVHHIRSTILGDAVARTLQFLGHTVIRQNHIGDFGTQFGKIIQYIRDHKLVDQPLRIEDLDRYYKAAAAQFNADPQFAAAARKTVVELQSGQPEAVKLWNAMRVATHAHYTEIYRLLNVQLTDDDERGESFYRERLPTLIEHVKATLEFGGEGPYVSSQAGTAADTLDDPIGHEPPDAALPQAQDAHHRLEEAGEPEVVTKPFAAYSNGAFCIFLPGYIGKDKTPLPLLLQKSDGGFPYAATDLAALYFRVREEKTTPEEQKPLRRNWHADRVLYFTNAPQSLHFAMVFDAFRAAQWDKNPVTGKTVSLEHAAFGSVLGEDNRPFKTRSGENVHLKTLLLEAIERAAAVKAEKGAELSPEKRAAVSRAVGIGAVKYADLRQDRNTDYVFAWERMLSLQGNTGPYLQMQYTRIASIYRKGGITPEQVRAAAPAITLEHEDEAAMAKKLLQFPGVVESVARDLKPHYLCTYLYELCEAFSRFFTNCPVLKAEPEGLKMSRLGLAGHVATVLKIGLEELLGIGVLEEM